jgi:5,10-methylenetetrahydromethanopterin reductase
MTEVWLHAFAIPSRVTEMARLAEELGFTGMSLADSQNLTGDIWVELALAGAATSSLRLGPGVTNPLTRHLAVTASAAATLQVETGGRVVLGLGHGDSALSRVGLERLAVPAFEDALEKLQRLLGGEKSRFGAVSSTIRWIGPAGVRKVPLHVAATGPRTVAAAARHAEGVDLTVGADLGRIRELVATINSQGSKGVSVGAYLNVAVDEDLGSARNLVRGSVATFSRFSARAVAANYDVQHHGEATAAQARALDDDFIDRFAVVGPPHDVRRRLLEIIEAGVERLIITAGSLDSDPEAVRRSNERLAADVMPL